jgi:hypothetical protein
MDPSLADRITLAITGTGAIIAVLCFAVLDSAAGVGALVGAGLAVANWLALRWVSNRLARGSGRERGSASLLLVLKMGLLMAVCWALVVRVGLDPTGFLLGMGAFVVGILAGSFGATPAPEPTEEES